MTALWLRLSQLLMLPLLPLILWQGKRTRKLTPRLAAAGGNCQGQSGNGEPLRLLHIGESTVAGVGIDDIEQGLTAQLSRQLDKDYCVQWQTLSANGLTAKQLLQHLPAGQIRCDVLIITLGVNDTTELTRRRHWRQHLKQLSQAIDCHTLLVTQVPPMQRFPALPRPLNWFLGVRAWQLDQVLQQLSQQQGWLYQSFEMALEPQWMATDGYHPNADGYRLWARSLASTLSGCLPTPAPKSEETATSDHEGGATP